jgi:hypothetical protein
VVIECEKKNAGVKKTWHTNKSPSSWALLRGLSV